MGRLSAGHVIASAGALLGLIVIVLVASYALLQPPPGDLAQLGIFLFISGSVTLVIGWLAIAVLPHRFPGGIRSQVVMLIALVAALAVANVAFTAQLMFISPHDLALLSFLLLFSFGISICLAYLLTLPFNATLRGFVAAVNQIAAGRLDSRVHVRGQDELRLLADAFNSMAEALEEAFARQRDLEHARRQLIAAVSHDLRNPLASMRAMVESINDGIVADEETIQRYLERLQREVEYLSRLIDDLFEVSQIDAGLIEIQLGWASLQDLISDALEGVSAQAAQRGVTVEGKIDESLPPILMDTRRVQRVLANLVQNALRHTPSDGTIRIEAKEAGGEVRVSVSDSGEGIPSEEIPHVFEQFFRGDRARSRDEGGSGLGLSIAQRIVAAHGGRIWADSEPGKGATFTFTLPKTPDGTIRRAATVRGRGE
jgi:signal transduction histidine kinase